MYTYEKMIDDCFDALKSINTIEWDDEALARVSAEVVYGMKL
jgi:hypothetical protein